MDIPLRPVRCVYPIVSLGATCSGRFMLCLKFLLHCTISGLVWASHKRACDGTSGCWGTHVGGTFTLLGGISNHGSALSA